MSAADETSLVPLLARISVNCARKKDDDQTAAFLLEVYIADLKAYPADIACAVLRWWPAISKFWPQWQELYALLEEMMINRRSSMNAYLQQFGLQTIGPTGGEVGALIRNAAKRLKIGAYAYV